MAGLLDEIRKSEALAQVQQRLQGLLNIPTAAQQFMVSPASFMGLLGSNPLPKETGFAAGATGLPAQEMSVLDPNQAPYMQGYSQGEPIGYGAMALPLAAPATVAAGKALAPKAGQALESYMASQGLMQNIVPVDVAKSIKMPTTLPTDDIFRKAVENTPGAMVTDEGLVMNLMRKQKPQQAETESVRGGVFYLPEGSASMKHYGGTNYYGGTEKVAGETLYKNPLVVKGATGGKAPEMAYEQLMGKDGYKAMQDDVQKAAFSGSQNMRNDLVEQFLENYAPDLSGYGSYIISNSKQGNQLRYALQEAAVAQKARDAGYDAVIGYSKKKSGDPFLSEVFDVREAIYPSTQGDYRLMDKFEGLLD
jgi:hypothetical protein